jgi:hypothetical protein
MIQYIKKIGYDSFTIHLPLIPFILCYLIQSIKIQLRRLNLRNYILINLCPRLIILKGIMPRGRRTLTFNILCCLVLNLEHLRTSPQQACRMIWGHAVGVDVGHVINVINRAFFFCVNQIHNKCKCSRWCV